MRFLPKKRTVFGLLAVAAMLLLPLAAQADSVSVGGSTTVTLSGTPSDLYSVSVTFSLNAAGTQLTIDLTNTATATNDASNVLTALLWSNMQGAGGTPLALTGVSDTVVGGSTVWNFNGTSNTVGTNYTVPPGGMSAQAEWGYGTISQFGANQWVTSFDGPTSSFPGAFITTTANAQDGLGWGLVGANGLTGGNLAHGVLTNPLSENSMEFVFNLSLPAGETTYYFDNLSAQYGTSFAEPNLPENGIIINPAPIPPSALLLGSGLLGLGLIGWRRRESKS